MKKPIAATAVALVVAGAAAVGITTAQADGPERNAYGSITGGHYEISVEKEGRFEVDADIDAVPAGSTWKMVVRHDGKRVATRTARATRDDGQYEVDFASVHRPDTTGKDAFTVTLKRVDGTAKVARTLRFAS